MIEFPCDCGHKIKFRIFEGVSQEKVEEIMNLDPFPTNWVKMLRATKQKGGQEFTIQQLEKILDKRTRPMGVQCIHCGKLKNLEDLVPATKFVVRPYRHPESLRGHSQMF